MVRSDGTLQSHHYGRSRSFLDEWGLEMNSKFDTVISCIVRLIETAESEEEIGLLMSAGESILKAYRRLLPNLDDSEMILYETMVEVYQEELDDASVYRMNNLLENIASV